MEHLPPVGWADVATKRDLDHLRADVDQRFELIDERFATRIADLRADLFRELNSQTTKLVGLNLTVGALVVAAIRLL